MSRILIPIFSTNYAESVWCLREASFIARQVLLTPGKGSTIAIPLFYNVTPSQVRRPAQLDGPYAEAFREHERSGRYSTQEICEWKAALFQLCRFSGWSLQEETNGYEAALVKRVVEEVAEHCRRSWFYFPAFTRFCIRAIRETSHKVCLIIFHPWLCLLNYFPSLSYGSCSVITN